MHGGNGLRRRVSTTPTPDSPTTSFSVNLLMVDGLLFASFRLRQSDSQLKHPPPSISCAQTSPYTRIELISRHGADFFEILRGKYHWDAHCLDKGAVRDPAGNRWSSDPCINLHLLRVA
jgi:hypothetical protein